MTGNKRKKHVDTDKIQGAKNKQQERQRIRTQEKREVLAALYDDFYDGVQVTRIQRIPKHKAPTMVYTKVPHELADRWDAVQKEREEVNQALLAIMKENRDESRG